MLLAEALNERADARARLIELRYRIAQNVRVPEGMAPAEDPQWLLDEAVDLNERIYELVVAINLTNAITTLPDGATLIEALARRDALSRRLRLVTDAAFRASDTLPRLGRPEVRQVATVDVGQLRAEADRVSVRRRELDIELQRINWTTETSVAV